jgi:hypothetical protein
MRFWSEFGRGGMEMGVKLAKGLEVKNPEKERAKKGYRMERGKTRLEKGITRREVAAPAPNHHAYARQK